jgi:hypothetical protein
MNEDDIAWVKAYAQEVTETFGRKFAAAGERLKDGERLLRRFNETIEMVLQKGMASFRAVDEAHNEICVPSSLLSGTKVKVVRLEYEPPLPGCAKTIDFRVCTEDGVKVFVDVKTIAGGGLVSGEFPGGSFRGRHGRRDMALVVRGAQQDA